jgi:hypothetical protein
MKPNIYSVDWVHPQLSHNGHPVDDGALVGAGSLWPGQSILPGSGGQNLMPQSAGKTNKKLKKIIFFLNLDTI